MRWSCGGSGVLRPGSVATPRREKNRTGSGIGKGKGLGLADAAGRSGDENVLVRRAVPEGRLRIDDLL